MMNRSNIFVHPVCRSVFRSLFEGVLFLCLIGFLYPGGATESFGTEIKIPLAQMTFESGAHDWKAGNHCRAYVKNNALCIEAQDGTPSLHRITERIGGQIHTRIELKTQDRSNLIVHWTTRGSPRRSEDKKVVLPLNHDGQWHEYEFIMQIHDVMETVSLEFTSPEGYWEIRSLTSSLQRRHPLLLQKVEPFSTDSSGVPDRLRYTIVNDAPVALKVHGENLEKAEVLIPSKGTMDFAVPVKSQGNLAAVKLILEAAPFPAIGFPVFLYIPDGTTDWIARPLGDRIFELDPSGRMARIRQGDRVVSIIAPLLHRNGTIPQWTEPLESTENGFLLDSPDAKLTLRFEGETVHFDIEDKQPPGEVGQIGHSLEGPCVRLMGTLTDGLLPGVEFLGPGDVSSSEIDLEPPHHDRSLPRPHWITMPLAVLGTDQVTALLYWNDMSLQPHFSTPNRIDRSPDHRMALIGYRYSASLVYMNSGITDGHSPAVQAIKHYIGLRGFPAVPASPRTSEDQFALCLKALSGPLQAGNRVHWGYAVEDVWPRDSYADILSTYVRLTDRIPPAKTIVQGGSDIANDAIYFMTDRPAFVDQWKRGREEAIRSILALSNPNGSFHYPTRFVEVESTSTSFGHTAVRALEIMEYVRLTGNDELFKRLVPSLQYLKRCQVPRGGFYRDSPLHTPDLLTSGTLLWLFVWAYEYSGEPEYLELARRFAYTGVPFVYQWSDREIMLYTAVPRLGGTARKLPLFFGTCQPRTAILYAYALSLLAGHDRSTDWKQLAQGILHACEQIQYSDGPSAGCVPELFVMESQERRSWAVNPCALVSLRRRLEGKLDSLDLFLDKITSSRSDRYVSPYPLRATSDGIEAYGVPEGRPFQVLLNGRRVLHATGPGRIPAE